MPKEFQHARVPAHHQRVEGPNPVIPRCVDQPTGQAYTYALALPAIFDDGRVLGPLFARFAIVANDRDDLVWVIRI